MKICDNCGAQMPDNAKFCARCGAVFRVKKPKRTRKGAITCPKCGFNVITKKAKFCPKCGTLLSAELANKVKVKRIIAPEGKIHKCSICMQDIKYGLVFCPSCTNAFHFNHLSQWIISNHNCPICKTKLELVDDD